MKKKLLFLGLLMLALLFMGCVSSTAACPNRSGCDQTGLGMCGQSQCGTNWFAPCNCK